jgi:type IV pilus assembly protein PilV
LVRARPVQARSIDGFTLIEVLVALLVLAVGVAGAVATHIKAQDTRHQSVLLSQATQLANSLAERMRANPVAMAGPDASNPYLQFDYDSASGLPPAPPSSCYGDASCSPAALAAFDLFETGSALHDGFPRARVRVCRDIAPWDESTSGLVWKCDGGTGAPVVIKLGWRLKAQAGAEPPFAPVVAVIASGKAP